jgi:HSP20 family protein
MVHTEDKSEIADMLGLGGLLKGLGSLIELVSDMAEKGIESQEKVAEFRGSGPLKDVRGIFGVSVRMGLGEAGASAREVRFEPFGNIARTEEGVRIESVREPLMDTFEEGEEILVVGELPGMEPEDIRIAVVGDILQVQAERGDRRYAKELLLAGPVDPDRVEHSYRNGILEIRLRKTERAP